MRAWRARTGDEQGFTIIEVVVALALISIVATGFMTSVALGFRTVSIARQRQTASEIASARLEFARNLSYDEVALDAQPVYNADPTHPNHWVLNGDTEYDITGNGDLEDLIVLPDDGDPATIDGSVRQLEDPKQVGSTVMEIYQYVTWVDDPTIVGQQDYKRLTVVVRFKAPSSHGVNQIVHASTLFTPGTVTLITPSSSTTTTTTAPSSTTTSSTTTTTSGACAGDTTPPTGAFTIGSSGSADAGYTASRNVSLQLSFTDTCAPIVANFSNDGITWGADVTFVSTSPTVSWSLTAGSGNKIVYGRVRDGNGSSVALTSSTIELDEGVPTTPGSVTRTASCQGSNRTVVLSWTPSSDAEGNFRGYRIFRSTDGTTWSQVGSTVSTTFSNTHSKSLTSVRFYLVAYDKAGNTSLGAPTPVISLAKNQCS